MNFRVKILQSIHLDLLQVELRHWHIGQASDMTEPQAERAGRTGRGGWRWPEAGLLRR